MEYLKEKVAYLKGLAEGLEISQESKEGKLIINIIETLDEFAEAIIDMSEVQDEMADYVDELDEDLSDLEEDFYEEDEYEQDDDFDNEYYEVECPNCGDTVVIEEESLANEDIVTCPNCKTEIEFDIDECECECEDCDCNHNEE